MALEEFRDDCIQTTINKEEVVPRCEDASTREVLTTFVRWRVG